jgi:hypothetical protein
MENDAHREQEAGKPDESTRIAVKFVHPIQRRDGSMGGYTCDSHRATVNGKELLRGDGETIEQFQERALKEGGSGTVAIFFPNEGISSRESGEQREDHETIVRKSRPTPHPENQ